MADTDPSEPTAEPTAEPAAAADPAPTAPTRSRALAVVAGILALLLVASVAVLVTTRSEVDDLQSAEDRRQAAATTAARFGEAYLSYDFDDVEGSSEAVLALVTDDFADDFQDNRAPGIAELFANLQTSTEAATQEVFVSDVTDDAARALVVVDVSATSAASGPQELTDLTFVVTMVADGDGWLVDEVTPAPQPNVAGQTPTTAPTAPTSSTTTTTAG